MFNKQINIGVVGSMKYLSALPLKIGKVPAGFVGKRKKKGDDSHSEGHVSFHDEQQGGIQLVSLGGMSGEQESRVIHLWGAVDANSSREICGRLLDYADAGSTEPVTLLINSPGGDTGEMFAIFDTIKLVSKIYPVRTCGVGAVMSAAVLILAAGEKGSRRVTKNTRVMLHQVQVGGMMGSLLEMEAEMKEVKYIQEKYIELLTQETALTEEHTKEIFTKSVSSYISAADAVKMSIADLVV